MDQMLDIIIGGGEETEVKTDAEPYKDSSIELYRSRLAAVE